MILRNTLIVIMVLAMPVIGLGQNRSTWSDVAADEISRSSGERRIAPTIARYVELDVEAMRAVLSQASVGMITQVAAATTVLTLPTPDGGSASYRILEVPVMHPDLQARFPMIRTYSGVGVEDPSAAVNLDLTPHGFHAMVVPGNRDAWYIDPVLTGNTLLYQVYAKRDFVKTHSEPFQGCGYDQVNDLEREQLRSRDWIAQAGEQRVGDCQLRTYRLALACTGEYAAYHGGTTTLVMAAMVTTMNRVNSMFQQDATLTMVMVPNNNNLIFLNAGTDPYSNTNGSAMLGENQTTCNNVIGSANYDIGHVFSTGGGGVAYLNSPCNNGNKAGGVTGQSNPVGDPFDIDYVAHEMGHQYGGNHTQNNSCNRASSAAVEVGSGVTIMGYAGICAPNPLNNSLAMFGGYSMQEIAANITVGTSSTCPALTPLGSQVAPVANAGLDRIIPRSTPFILTGSGTDANGGDALTYSWEQMDNAVATMPPVATATGGPAWVPLLPMTTPVRYMPNLPAVIANTSPTWEVLPSVARTLNFRLTVRDNVASNGCNGQDNMVVTVSGSSGPFIVTQPNTAVNWAGLSSQTITWNVASTSSAPVSCANVDILLSTDGGTTYPFTILANTPNDGTQSVTIPNQPSTTARVMVRANGNIFYDISNTNFTISTPSVPDYTLGVTSSSATVCQPNSATYAIQIGSVLGYNSPVTLSASGLPAGANASFTPNPVTPAGASTLTVSNTIGIAPGLHSFALNATSASGNKSIPLNLTVVATPGQVALSSPANGAVDASGPLTWNADPEASSYTVNIASDPGMTNILESAAGVGGTTYSPTTANLPTTTYYWNVVATSSCGNGPTSSTWSYTTSNCSNVTIKIVLDRYGAETTWSVRNGVGTVFASGGPYTTVGTNGEYPQQDIVVCLPAGCYDLIVNDSANDGLCCAYGNGYIAVVDGILPLAFASTFTTTATVNFCVPTSCTSAFPVLENFESGTGGWVQAFDDDMDWTRLSGSTPSAGTGPTGDHTTGNGSYMYTESSSPNFPSKVAELIGPCLDLTGLSTATMTFWYNMLGADMGTLNVDVWNGTTWTLSAFSLSGAQGSAWLQATVNLDAYVGNSIRIRFRGVTGSGFASDMAIDDIQIDGSATPQVLVSAQVWLEGPYKVATGLMVDSLRTRGYIPMSEPYSGMGFTQVGGGGESTTGSVFQTTGNNAIVDWVLVELRSTADPSVIRATRTALLQRDGDVVDVDGVSPLAFPIANGTYHVAVRHRNHFGCMTASGVPLSSTATVVDLRSAGTPTYGTNARKAISGVQAMWAGNAFRDGSVKYVGVDNDRDRILFRIGGTIATNVVNGFYMEDLNLDASVKYAGLDNDSDIILVNIGGAVATNSISEQMPP